MIEELKLIIRSALTLAVVLTLSACDGIGLSEFSATSDGPASLDSEANREFYPNEQELVEGQAQFNEGNYGLAFQAYRKAVNAANTDPAAWLGYAASADMLGRFDESEKAYRLLKPVIGNRIEYLNNYGYSLLLRGELREARKYFVRAYEIDPSNEFAANNLEMLRNSVNYPRRSAGDLRSL